MSILKEFFNKRILLNCIVFSVPISVLFMWRFTHIRAIPFFSTTAGIIYLVFVAIDFLMLLIVFYILYWLSKRPQED